MSLLFAALMLLSCSKDDDNMPGREAELNLNLNTLVNVQTPYQHVFNPGKAISNARVNNDADKTAIMNKIKEIFPQANFIDDIDDEIERGIPVWEVEIELTNGGDLDFYISKDLLEVVKIEGDDDFNGININPGGNFISLAQAVNAAKQAYNGEIDDWELELDNGTRWVYEFDFEDDSTNNDDVEVYVDAFTGNVIAVYTDDDGNDDDDDDDDDDSSDDDDDDDDD